MKRMQGVVALLIGVSLPVAAEPSLSPLFSDHMVLQQGREAPVWGWAAPGERVTVSMLDISRHTAAGADGRWKVMLPAMEAGGPYGLTVTGMGTIALRDVMVGEVWICSGQSNMDFTLGRASTAHEDVPDADYSGIRLLRAPNRSSLVPEDKLTGSGWQPCTPDRVRDFSAVGYLFARELHKRLGVPVGIIQSTWSGTAAELWTSEAALRSDTEFAPILQRWEEASPEAKELARRPHRFELFFDDFELLRPAGEPAAEPLKLEWRYTWNNPPATAFELVRAGRKGQGFSVHLAGAMAANDSPVLGAHFQPKGKPRDLSGFAGLRFYCRGNGFFRIASRQPTIVDSDNYGTGVFRATADWRPVTVWFKDLKQAGWGVRNSFTPETLSGFQIEVQRSASGAPLPPASLFNGMIAPLAPYGMRGAIWYQGEGNAGRAYQYRKLLPAMIGSWRAAWDQGDFPFLIVQLPNFGRRDAEPGESAWAELREAQLLALRTPNTGLAVTLGLGESGNVHPNRKAEVAERLARWALGTTYGRAGAYSGPLFEAAAVEGGRVRIRFRHAGKGLEAHGGSSLRGFAIAGADRKFRWAEARIEGETVTVSSESVPAPVAVRYAWGADPDGNLFNQDGLPAAPFRTDDWPGMTAEQR